MPRVGADVFTVRGHRLDEQQLAAVMDDSDTQLVVAGAGTGKTTTLIGKVKHLVEDLGVDPDGILMISLTNNTVDDLRAAVESEFGAGFGADVMTIHALGNRIVRRRACVGKARNELLKGIIYELVESDRRCARSLMLYVEGLRGAGYSDMALNGTSIRNRGLRIVADALFERGVRCDYARPSYDGSEPTPGFISVDDGQGHRFRLYSDDEASKLAAKDPRTAVDFITGRGITGDRINENDLAAEVLMSWNDRIPETVGSFISRCKCTQTTIRDLRRSNGRNPASIRGGVDDRLDLLDRIWDMYTLACLDGNLSDYDDMVIQAANEVRSGKNPGKSYTHVLIDEYQDVSRILVDLIKALREVMGFRLFCVGDDWQSIYSFSGGDVWQMYDFGKVWSGWGTVSETRIERTYRSPQQMVDMASRFVQKNPQQMRKNVRSLGSAQRTPVQLLPVGSDREIPRMIANRLDYIDPSYTVMVIGRTRSDVYALGNGSGAFSFNASGTSGSIDVRYRHWDEDTADWVDFRNLAFMTAHSSKGLEADVVFLLADRDRGGFPSTVSDALSDLFSVRDEGITYPEERRVFYVAMTRARRLMFMVNRMDEDRYAQSATSPFMAEIIEDNPMLAGSTPFCSRCFGPMRISNSNGRLFYGCCDYPRCSCTKPFNGF